jgi:hypothetical protein
MIRAGIIDEFWDGLFGRLQGLWDFVTDPLWMWYFWGFVFFIVCVIVAYFLPFKWVRAGLGGAVLLMLAFVFGGKRMHDDMQAQVEREKQKRIAAEQQNNNQGGGQPGGGSWWPFN